MTKKKKKRKKGSTKSRLGSIPNVIYRPSLPDMGAPEGFRSISMSQAMMEYAKSIMEFVKDEENNLGHVNAVMQVSMLLWNYSTAVQRGSEDKKLEKEVLGILKTFFGLDKTNAQALLTKMVERHGYLFPKEIQPEMSMFMFIRKEKQYLIKPFDYNQLVLSSETIPPDQNDRDLINKIKELDSYIREGAEHEMYEGLLVSLKDECVVVFEEWLIAKGLEDYAEVFSSRLSIYFDFIYGYMHNDIVILESVSHTYLVEFFEDFLLRKLMTEPTEYVYWPPALKLFYQFLFEKKYIDNYKKIIGKIDKVEPYFIKVLKKQFS
jgi:hypothetical protein